MKKLIGIFLLGIAFGYLLGLVHQAAQKHHELELMEEVYEN